jgi:hypothetical protein
MWGNDPNITDTKLHESAADRYQDQPQPQGNLDQSQHHRASTTHLGWNGRLNGPVDNPNSSCLSCHMTAETPTLSALNPLFQKNPPPVGSSNWMRWFQNLDCAKPFDSAAQSADYSLQLAIGLANFELWKAPAESASSRATTPPR